MSAAQDVVHPPPEQHRADDNPLRRYVEAKQAVVTALNSTRSACRLVPGSDERIRRLLSRLAEDRFQLVVVGQFKRGKTSLINAILGRDLLPTAAIPLTSVVTSLCYGFTDAAAIDRAGRAFLERVPLAALADFITERGNPRNEKHVLAAEVQLPAPFLRRGLRFIDTPGIGSMHEHNTATTYAFLSEADAVVFVTSADAPLADAELVFLDAIRQHVRRLFLVLNKIDQAPDGERTELAAFTAQALAVRLGVPSVRVFAVSARQALAAKQSADTAALAESGLPALESALAEFLAEERGRVFLVAFLDRALRFVDEALFLDGLGRKGGEMEDASGLAAKLRQRWGELEEQRRALLGYLRDRVRAWSESLLAPLLETLESEATAALATALPATAAAYSALGPREYEGRLRRWIADRLAEHTTACLQEQTARLDEMARALAAEARPPLTTLARQPLRVAALLLAVERGTNPLPAAESDSAWDWTPPPFVPREIVRPETKEPIDLRFPAFPFDWPLPRPLARRRALRRIRQTLEREVARTAAQLRAAVTGYLDACVQGIDISSADQMTAEKRRVERALHLDAPTADTLQRSAEISQDLERVRANLTALRDALLRNEPPPAGAAVSVLARPPITDDKSAATATDGHNGVRSGPRSAPGGRSVCHVCTLAWDAVFAFLCHYQYATSNEATAKNEFLASGGLCPSHTWQLERFSSPRGLCATYPPFLEDFGRRLHSLIGLKGDAAGERIDSLFARSAGCAACLALARAERDAISTIIEDARGGGGRVILDAIAPVCTRHLGLLLRSVDDDMAEALVRRQADRVIAVAESMQAYALKFDALRRDLLTEEESWAYRDALVLLIGEKNLFVVKNEGEP